MEQQEGDLRDIETDSVQQVGLSDTFIGTVSDMLDHGFDASIRELCLDMPAPDAGELLTKLDSNRRHALIKTLGDELDPETFAYLDHEILNSLMEDMPSRQIAGIVNALDSDDAIRLIENLDEDRRGDVLDLLRRNLRAVVEEGLTYPEESAGRLMQHEFVAVPQFWTVGKTVDYLRAAANALPDTFHNIFIVDPMHRFVGTVTLSRVLCAQRGVKIDTLVDDEYVAIPVDMDRSDVALIFSRKDLLSAPVIDDEGQLLGILTVDDIVDVIDEEAEKDILNLSGVSDSDIHHPVFSTANARFVWLAINVLTALVSVSIINLFKGTIEKVVVLAALMPFVAGMAGNAGGQTLAVAVRALATKDLSATNSLRVIVKESLVGLINGLLLGLMVGSIVYLWFHDLRLGFIMTGAMMLNLMAAGLAGAGIPIIMQRLGHDPAPSSSVFMTMITDSIGFFSFLGLATWLLI